VTDERTIARAVQKGIIDSLLFLSIAALLVTCVVRLIDAAAGTTGLTSTWPETAKFKQLMTGQDRFSEHETNISGTYVLVDHETGVCYVCTPDGVAVMVDAEGEPMRDKEAA